MESSPILAALVCGVIVFALGIFRILSREKEAPKLEAPEREIVAQAGRERESEETLAQEEQGVPLNIYFGSQTGTAEGFAETIKSESEAHGFASKVIDLEDFDEEELKSCGHAVFLMATYGEGEPTDNANAFVKWIKSERKELGGVDPSEGPLTALHFAVFGLGNKQYEQFNSVGKNVDAGLAALGAERGFELGLGDDDADIEEDFEGWRDKFWPAFSAKYAGSGKGGGVAAAGGATDVASLPPLPFELKVLPPGAASGAAELAAARSSTAAPSHARSSTAHYFTATRVKVMVNRELRSPLGPEERGGLQFGGDMGGSTRHVEVDIHGTGLKYETADNLAVLPENDPEDVEALGAAMGWDLDQCIELVAAAAAGAFKLGFPTPCPVREALSAYVDLGGLPRRTSLKDWAAFCTDPAEAAALTTMAGKSAEGKAAYKARVEAPQRSLLDVLTTDFRSLKVPLAHFLHLAPPLQPRYYTISSSDKAHPKRIHLTVAVLATPKPGGGTLRGVCSTFLQGLDPPATDGSGKRTGEGALLVDKRGLADGKRAKRGPWPSCRVFVRPSTFRLPTDPRTPIVLVGPGTGIAPMRALLQERAHQHAAAAAAAGGESQAAVGPSVLYFGCKHEAYDFLYADELRALEQNGVLTALHVAVSRPGLVAARGGGRGGEKVYVQHLMGRPAHRAELWRLLDGQGGHLYVCGGTAMGADVQRAVVELVGAEGGKDAAEAENYVAALKAQGRYVQELWA